MKRLSFLTALILMANTTAQATILRFSIPTGENSVGKEQMSKTLQMMFDVVKTKTGITLQLDPIAAYTIAKQKGIPGHLIRLREYESRLKTGKTDVVGITAEEYFTNPSLAALVEPGFAWTVNQKKTGNECLYVREGGPIKTVQDLKGKTISGLTSYVTVRRILAANGIDMPLNKFFGKFIFQDDPTAQYEGLLKGRSDVFHDTWQGWYFYKNLKPEFKKVKPLACVKDQPLIFFALRKGADKAAADKVLNYLMTAHRDPAMGQARWFFVAFNGAFFKFGQEYFGAYKQQWQQAVSKGWVNEAKQWHTKDYPALFKVWLKHNT